LFNLAVIVSAFFGGVTILLWALGEREHGFTLERTGVPRQPHWRFGSDGGTVSLLMWSDWPVTMVSGPSTAPVNDVHEIVRFGGLYAVFWHRKIIAPAAGPAAAPSGWNLVAEIPIGWPLVLTLTLPTIWFVRALHRRGRNTPGRCPACGYDLRATPDRCPECGMIAAPAAEATGAPPPSRG
jgi:hypothetical protein